MRLLKTHSSRIRCRFLWNHCMVLKGIYRFSRGVISFLSWIRFSFLVFFCLFRLGNCLFCLYETNPSVTHTYRHTHRKKRKRLLLVVDEVLWVSEGLGLERKYWCQKKSVGAEENCWRDRYLFHFKFCRAVFISHQVLSSFWWERNGKRPCHAMFFLLLYI